MVTATACIVWRMTSKCERDLASDPFGFDGEGMNEVQLS